MDVFEGKNKRCRKQLTKRVRNKVLRSRPRASMIVVSFANFKSRALTCNLSGDFVMPRAEVPLETRLLTKINIVLSHLKAI